MFYETATVEARALDTATAAVTILDREAIEALDVSTVGELLRFVPGLDVTSGGPRGAVATGQIRGGDPNFTAVLLDGVPLNDSTDQFGGSVNLNSLPVAQVERIEVVRGPLSSFFGSTGLAGAINVITRRGGSSDPELSFGLAAGDASVVQGDIALSGGGDERDYLVGISWEQERDRVADDEFRQLALQGGIGSAIGERTELRVNGRVTSWEAEDYPDASAGLLGTRETRRSEHDEASLGVEWRIGEQGRRHRLQLGVYHHRLERQSPGVPPFDPSDPFATFVPPSVEQTRYTTWQVGWAFPVFDNGRTRVHVGADVEEERGTNESLLTVAPGFDLDGSYSIDRTTGGAFVELLSERGPLVLELDLRLDAPEGFDNEPGARAGLSYRPADRTRLRFSVGRAFKLPSFFALASPAALGGNPDLEPEVSTGFEAGIEQELGSTGLSGLLGVFVYRFEDLIDFSFDPATFGLINRGEVESRGAEVGLGWRGSERLVVELNLTRQDVEDRETSAPLRNRPDWIVGARVGGRVAARLRWSVDGQSVSERFDQQIPVPQRDTVSGYQVYGASAAFDVRSGWTIHGRIDNLLDEDYETLIGFPGGGRGFRIGLRHRAQR